MKLLLATTEDFIKRERTAVATDALPGNSVVLTVKNSDNFAINDYVVIGWEGSEQAEMGKVTAASGGTITVDVLKLPHKADEPVTKYRYNKRKFYGSLDGLTNFIELTGYGSPVQIQVDDPQGTYLEYSGNEGYLYFKATYWNSTTSEETNVQDSDTVYGDESGRYCSIYAIRKQAGLTNNPFITDGIIETYRKRAENEIDSYLNARYYLPLTNSSNVQEVPFLVENCAVLLGAGYIDYQEFGSEGEGVKWLGEARSILKALQTPGGQQLLARDKTEMNQKTLSNGIQSYPNTVDDTNGPQQTFTMRQRF